MSGTTAVSHPCPDCAAAIKATAFLVRRLQRARRSNAALSAALTDALAQRDRYRDEVRALNLAVRRLTTKEIV